MSINWNRKLPSRKFLAAVAGLVGMLLIHFGKDAGAAEQTAAVVMAAASLIAYIVGEGLADQSGERRAESGDRRKDGGEDDVSDAG